MIQKPFFLDENLCLDPVGRHTISDYERWFTNPRLVQPGQARPRTLEEIEIWLTEIEGNKKNIYFSIRIGRENVGHLGIREIDAAEGQAELDLFIAKEELVDHLDKRAIFAWLRCFLTTRLMVDRLAVPGGGGDGAEILMEAGYRPVGHDSRGSRIYKVSC
jgi:hypothetical protein